MARLPLFRIAAVAIGLSTASFAAGVVGDLFLPEPAHGVRVVVRIPPDPSMPGSDAREVSGLLPHTALAEASPRPTRRRASLAHRREITAPDLVVCASAHELAHSEPEMVNLLAQAPEMAIPV